MFPGEEYTFLTAPEYLTVSSKVCKGSNCISLILLFFVQTAYILSAGGFMSTQQQLLWLLL